MSTSPPTVTFPARPITRGRRSGVGAALAPSGALRPREAEQAPRPRGRVAGRRPGQSRCQRPAGPRPGARRHRAGGHRPARGAPATAARTRCRTLRRASEDRLEGGRSWRQESRPAQRLNHFQRATERRVIRRKSFTMTPCTIDDAIAEMELLDYDFHLFTEKGSGTVGCSIAANPRDIGWHWWLPRWRTSWRRSPTPSP